jgi:hypothetical protein
MPDGRMYFPMIAIDRIVSISSPVVEGTEGTAGAERRDYEAPRIERTFRGAQFTYQLV